ncbi:MAG: PEGA domain-containing protein [Proteobacteria bacterium]|nr:PEGA domain-containing protein [Pseudomonadota bacterium]
MIEKEEYLGALDAFEASYRLRPRSTVLFNIAMCQKALYRYADAVTSFLRFLDEDQISPDMREMAQSSLDELMQLVGKLDITEAPEGARVNIDGNLIGTLPLEEPIVLDPGRHTVEVTREEFEPLKIDVTLTSGARIVVRAKLNPVHATLHIMCDVATGTISLDGKLLGGCPDEIKVSPGKHTIRVEAQNRAPFVKEIEAAPNSKTAIQATLKKLVSGTSESRMLVQGRQPKKDGPAWLRIGGWTGIGAGIVAGGIGGYFASQWNKNLSRLEELQVKVNAANTPGNINEWTQLKSNFDSVKKKTENDKLGLTIGFAAGSALMITGIVLLVWDATQKSRGKAVAVWPTPSGIWIQF